MKKTDIFLNVLLVILIISAAVLTIRVWAFDTGMLSKEAALPRFITRLENGLKYGVFLDARESVPENTMIESSLIYPQDIVFCTDAGSRIMPPFDSGLRQSINGTASSLIGVVMSSDDCVVNFVYENEIREALSFNCVCFSYGYKLDFSLYSKYLGLISDRFLNYDSFDCAVIAQRGDRIFVYFFLKDTNEGIGASMPADGRVSAMYAALQSDKSSFVPCSFGYELSDELSFELPPYCVLSNEVVNAPKLSSYPYISPVEEGQEKIRKAEKLLKPFGFNSSSGRWYENADELSYISDYATLSFTYDGFFEYKALSADRGFTPAGASEAAVLDQSQIISTAAALISSIYSSALSDNVSSATYAGMEKNMQTNTVRIYFDYFFGGVALYKNGAPKGYGAVIDINDRGEIVYAKLISDVIREETVRAEAIPRDLLFYTIELHGYENISSIKFLYSQSNDKTEYIAGYSVQTGGGA
ncbi:MAG: hypothetical protein IJG50_03745 [Clostridia bacterium]|nr:hypothetical protein [Clostridia bacterium]